MATGDIHIQSKFVSDMTKTSLAALWATNTIKCGYITSSTTPSVTDSDPRWGSGGTQNYSTNECTPGGNYSAGGVTLAGCTSTLSGAVASLNATSPINVAANASNPTNARWGILYDSTDTGKHVFGYIDLGSVRSMVPGLEIDLNAVASGTQPVFAGTAT